MVRSLLALAVAAVLALPAAAQTTLMQQSFEDGTGYTTSIAEYTDGFNDFFARTDTTDVSDNYQIDGFDGRWIFAAQDIDSEGAELPVRLEISDIDITGATGLSFAGLFAEDVASNGDLDWDDADFVHVKYRIDSDDDADFQNLLWFEGADFTSSNGVSNGNARQDTDFDGEGDGAILTDQLTEFSAAIAGTGSTLDIVIFFSLNSGDEDIAIDNLRVTGTVAGPSNQAPTSDTVMDGAMFDVAVGDTYTATYSFSDADAGDVVSVAVTNGPTNFTATPTAGNPATVDVSFAPDASQANQSYRVVFTASDGNGGQTAVNVTFNVGDAPPPPNAPPTSDTVMDGASFDVAVGGTYAATYSFSDADAGDAVSVAVANAPANFSATPTAGNPATVDVSFTPSRAQADQSYTVTFTATDGNGGSTAVDVTFNVGPAPPTGNAAPTSDTVRNNSRITVEAGEVYTATYAFSDADAGDVVSVAVEANGLANFSATPTAGNPATVDVRFAPDASQADAEYAVVFTASDGNGGQTATRVVFRVPDAGTPPPPTGSIDFELRRPSGDVTIPSAGGAFRIKAGVRNTGTETATVDVWGVADVGMGPQVFAKPVTLTLAPGEGDFAFFTQKVPARIPDGAYTYTVYAGDFFAGNAGQGDGALASASFTVTKGAAALKGAGVAAVVPMTVAPNPAADRAVLAFGLDAAATVRVAVYDALGREVAVVAEGEMGPGQHRPSLDAAALPAGVYVWRLSTDAGRVETGRLTVVR